MKRLTLWGVAYVRQPRGLVSRRLVLSCHLTMWMVVWFKLQECGWCAIRVRVCEGEATGRGALRWEGVFKGSRSVSERVLGG